MSTVAMALWVQPLLSDIDP